MVCVYPKRLWSFGKTEKARPAITQDGLCELANDDIYCAGLPARETTPDVKEQVVDHGFFQDGLEAT